MKDYRDDWINEWIKVIDSRSLKVETIQRVLYSGALDSFKARVELEKKRVYEWLQALASVSDETSVQHPFTMYNLGNHKQFP